MRSPSEKTRLLRPISGVKHDDCDTPDVNTSVQKNNRERESKNGINSVFLGRLKVLVKLAYSGTTDTALLLMIMACSVIEQVAVYIIGQTVGVFYRSIVEYDGDLFMYAAIWTAGCMLCATVCSSLVLLFAGYVGARWRSKLVHGIHKHYLGGSTLEYYRINFETELDNPDQRITEDADRWSQTFALMFGDMLSAPLIVIYYTFYTVFRLGWIAPVTVYAYFVLGAVVNRAAMKPIVPAVFEQERLEGNFRFTHMRIRTHAECVAFFRGEPHEQQLADAGLDAVVKNRKLILGKEFILNIAAKGFAYAGSLLNYAVIACVIFYFRPKSISSKSGDIVEFISQTATGCLMLVSGFTSLIQLSSNMSDLAGYTARVSELLEFLLEKVYTSTGFVDGGDGGNENGKENDEDESSLSISFSSGGAETPSSSSSSPTSASASPFRHPTPEEYGYGYGSASIEDAGHIHIHTRWYSDDATCVALENVTCKTPSPSSHAVVNDLSFVVRLNVSESDKIKENLLIKAPSGCGKSTILRVLAGLWPADSGVVRRPPHIGYGGIFYLPQQPYLPSGTLRDLIHYPSVLNPVIGHGNEDSKAVLSILDDLNLSTLVSRLQIEMEEEKEKENGQVSELSVGASVTLNPSTATVDTEIDTMNVLDGVSIVDWNKILSPGEQQRICLARLLYHCPTVAVLDEATSSLDIDGERMVYSLLIKKGIVCISVGHRDTLLEFHGRALFLNGKGGWKIKAI